MKRLESHRDVLKALLDGKKVKQRHWASTTFHLDEDGTLRTHKGRHAGSLKLDDSTEWHLDIPTKAVAQYAWQTESGSWILFDQLLTRDEVERFRLADSDIKDVQMIGEFIEVECKGANNGN